MRIIKRNVNSGKKCKLEKKGFGKRKNLRNVLLTSKQTINASVH